MGGPTTEIATDGRPASGGRGPTPPSIAVVEAISDAEGVAPTALDEPLYDAIDPDALDRLFTSETAAGRVVFTASGYEVTVTADGRVEVSPIE